MNSSQLVHCGENMVLTTTHLDIENSHKRNKSYSSHGKIAKNMGTLRKWWSVKILWQWPNMEMRMDFLDSQVGEGGAILWRPIKGIFDPYSNPILKRNVMKQKGNLLSKNQEPTLMYWHWMQRTQLSWGKMQLVKNFSQLFGYVTFKETGKTPPIFLLLLSIWEFTLHSMWNKIFNVKFKWLGESIWQRMQMMLLMLILPP